MKHYIKFLGLFFSFSNIVFAEPLYITDNLYSYLRVGPGVHFKILGSIYAGSKVETIAVNKKAGFTKIIDGKKRTGWVESRFIKSEPSLRAKNLKLQSTLVELRQNKLKTDMLLTAQENKLNNLTKQVSLTKNQLKLAKLENNHLEKQLDTKETDLLMRWFSYGGSVAGLGVLLGLMLPHLLPKKRTKDRWN